MAGKAILIKDVLFNALRTDTDIRAFLEKDFPLEALPVVDEAKALAASE